MTTITVINETTGAANGNFDAAAYAGVTFFATGLAAAEEVDIMLGGGAVLVPACDAAGPIKLTATSPSRHLPGGPAYVLQKDATVAAGAVYGSPRID